MIAAICVIHPAAWIDNNRPMITCLSLSCLKSPPRTRLEETPRASDRYLQQAALCIL
jgi:hypothetical protein